MPPKKTPTTRDSTEDTMVENLSWMKNDMAELKTSIASILKNMDKRFEDMSRRLEKRFEEALEEIKRLRENSKLKDQEIKELKDRVEELDQQAKLNEVIVTGLKIKPRSYAKAASAGTSAAVEPDESETKSVEAQVSEFFTSKNIEVDFNNVEVCYLLPKKGDNNYTTRAVILRFTNRKCKTALLKQGKKLMGSNVYINENLTKKNATIAKKARDLRKKGKIQHTWSANCRIYIKTNGATPEDVKTVLIRNEDELLKYDN